MRKTTLSIICSICLLSLQAQYQQLNQADNIIKAQISLVDGQFVLDDDIVESSPLVRYISASLQNGEIVIDYLLRSGEQDQNYLVHLDAILNGYSLTIYREDVIGIIGEPIAATSENTQQIIWTRLFERYINLDGSLTLNLSVELWGVPKLPFGIECGNPPTFTGKQKLPYFIAAGVGVASLGASLLFNIKSDDTYENDYLMQNFEEAAEPFYQKANDDHHKSLIFRYAGIAVLSIDAALYIFRSIRHRNKMDAYEEYCRDNTAVEFRPMVEWATISTPGQIGLTLTYSFGK